MNWDGSDYTGFDANSIVLLDNTLLTESVYIPRETTADASSGLTEDEITIVNEVISQGGMMDVDGAITYDGSNYVMDDRTGNGICFDFDVKITVVE